MYCKWCNEGNEAALLDINGVRCDVSGSEEGCWGHAYERRKGENRGGWWPCQRKAAEEHALVDKLPTDAEGTRCLPGDVRWGVCATGTGAKLLSGRVLWCPEDRWFIGFGIRGVPISVKNGYSTREAAEAAKGK